MVVMTKGSFSDSPIPIETEINKMIETLSVPQVIVMSVINY